MKTSDISFLNGAEKITFLAYQAPRKHSVIISEVVSRLAAVLLLSSAAALDIAAHSLFILPTLAYSVGKSVYQWNADFTLPWQHLQRIRNAVAPLLLGSALGALHPFAGLGVCEPTDKHIVLGILSSNSGETFETPCSPIHSLSIIEEIALNNRFVEINGEKKEIFSAEHIKAIKEAKNFEKSLESLQAQEFIHKITNITLCVMAKIKNGIENSNFDDKSKAILVRASGLLIPILTTIDITITLIAQVFFLATGLTRIISGRGPIYTEVTTNPLMHVSFLIQNILKLVGNLLGTCVYVVSPITGFKVSLILPTAFFKMQMKLLMFQIRIKMHFAKDNTRFVVPIVYGDGECSALSVPTHSMHTTYLVVEKKNGVFNLYWVNRPNIQLKKSLDSKTALNQIQTMLDERFPFMDIEKMMNYPVISKQPDFSGAEHYAKITPQGNDTNCVVSNLFGTLEAIDIIRGESLQVTQLRNTVVREYLTKNYGFYQKGFSPFTDIANGCSLKKTWDAIKLFPNASI